MFQTSKPRTFWIGLTIFLYSLFLLLQGLWALLDYTLLYPQMYLTPFNYVPNHNWVFTMIGAIFPSVAGGIIFAFIGLYIIDYTGKPKAVAGWAAISYSFVLLAQTVWLLFFWPNYYPQITWYLSTNIFMNYPIFFRMLGVVLPPLIGFGLFLTTGFFATKTNLRKI